MSSAAVSSVHVMFRNAPQYININEIETIYDIGLLIRLEKEYDEFIENESDLQYYDHLLEECLEIRDAIKIHLDRCIRLDILRKFYYTKN
jgi:hypothetical protein